MTNSTPLSPAAQAVVDASLAAYWRPVIDTPVFHNKSIAAALRAAYWRPVIDTPVFHNKSIAAALRAAYWRPVIDTPVFHNKSIAAALRAAADGWRAEVGGVTQTDFIRGVLRSAEALEEIAAELEGAQ
jgi:hypothetical protein